MKIEILKSALALTAVLALVSCGTSNGSNNGEGDSSEIPTNVQDAIDSTTSTLSQELVNTLSYMRYYVANAQNQVLKKMGV